MKNNYVANQKKLIAETIKLAKASAYTDVLIRLAEVLEKESLCSNGKRIIKQVMKEFEKKQYENLGDN